MTSLQEWKHAADESLARSRRRREPSEWPSPWIFFTVAIVFAFIFVLVLNQIQGI